ncbi:MAG TPA: hypothetical protein VFS15_15700 [Kofleriaceae bacterium]|nr:hypothetical protein [Kofleriaceae bacterium]
MTRALYLAVTFVALACSGCHEKQEVTAPPPPLRPEPEPKPVVQVAKDCDPIDPTNEPIPIAFDQRSIPEGARLAERGAGELKDAGNPEADRLTREQLMTAAVNDFITALAADPYNVKATYGLAAAYAQIDRKQCSINLLTRLLQMRPHASKKVEVEKMLDKLLGRRQPLDPDFSEMRRDNRFRDLIAKMCADTNDPNCVYGGQKSGH